MRLNIWILVWKGLKDFQPVSGDLEALKNYRHRNHQKSVAPRFGMGAKPFELRDPSQIRFRKHFSTIGHLYCRSTWIVEWQEASRLHLLENKEVSSNSGKILNSKEQRWHLV